MKDEIFEEEECLCSGVVSTIGVTSLTTKPLACTACGQMATKECTNCLIAYCPSHFPPQSYPDKNNVLPYKCPFCCSKRSVGGVSFIAPTECDTLPNILFQPNVKETTSQEITDLFVKVIQEGSTYLTILPDDESLLKDYLMTPSKRSLIAQSCHVLQRGPVDGEEFFQDKRTLFFHYFHSEPSRLVDNFSIPLSSTRDPYEMNLQRAKPILEASNIFLGMMIRKAVNHNITSSGAVSLSEKDSKKLHVRFELYVGRELWMSFSYEHRSQLKYLQRLSEDYFQFLFSKWTTKNKLTCALDSLSGAPTANSIIPLHLAWTRDCFKVGVFSEDENITLADKTFVKKTWYFDANDLPDNYRAKYPTVVPKKIKLTAAACRFLHSPSFHQQKDEFEVSAFPVGMISYHGLFDEEEIKELEANADVLDSYARSGGYAKENVPLTCQPTYKGTKLARTKFFFAARYLWHADQVKNKQLANRAEGIRLDVSSVPEWMRTHVERRLVERGVLPGGWVNSFAMNIYHDGSEGIKQHFDDIKRFDRPIVSLKLFSTSRLTFGALGFAMSNAQFFIPLPRGSVSVMGPGYASEALKHCVRPADLADKSATVLLRRIYPNLLEEAKEILNEERNQQLCKPAQQEVTTTTPISTQLEPESQNSLKRGLEGPTSLPSQPSEVANPTPVQRPRPLQSAKPKSPCTPEAPPRPKPLQVRNPKPIQFQLTSFSEPSSQGNNHSNQDTKSSIQRTLASLLSSNAFPSSSLFTHYQLAQSNPVNLSPDNLICQSPTGSTDHQLNSPQQSSPSPSPNKYNDNHLIPPSASYSPSTPHFPLSPPIPPASPSPNPISSSVMMSPVKPLSSTSPYPYGSSFVSSQSTPHTLSNFGLPNSMYLHHQSRGQEMIKNGAQQSQSPIRTPQSRSIVSSPNLIEFLQTSITRRPFPPGSTQLASSGAGPIQDDQRTNFHPGTGSSALSQNAPPPPSGVDLRRDPFSHCIGLNFQTSHTDNRALQSIYNNHLYNPSLGGDGAVSHMMMGQSDINWPVAKRPKPSQDQVNLSPN